MSIALLPFHAGPNTPAGFARQLAHFTSDIVRTLTKIDIQIVSYMAQIQEDPPKYANINPSEKLNETELIQQFFKQSNVDMLADGLLEQNQELNYHLTVRFFEKSIAVPKHQIEIDLNSSNFFNSIRQLAIEFAQRFTESSIALPEGDQNLFGTLSPEAFIHFLEGYDTLQYIERTQGQVVKEFDPQASFDHLLKAIHIDPDWDAPFMTLLQLCRASVQGQLGDLPSIEKLLQGLLEKNKEDARIYFALGELYAQMGEGEKAINALEKAHQSQPDEASILTQLGVLQSQMGMPHNAEKNIRRALELEGEDKPSADLLAQILSNTGREHEVPPLWKSILDKNIQNAQAHVKYALSLLSNKQEEEAIRAFDTALEVLEDNSLVKRYYAPLLTQKGDIERAMDYYEDCIEVTAKDVPLLIEYAQVLQTADRNFEIPKILKDILEIESDLNTRANVQAWLIELEQPQRIEVVQTAQNKMEQGDLQGAIQDLSSLTQWLNEYWKLWGLLATAYNRAQQPEQALEAAQKAIQIFPACEPAYGELATAFATQNKHEEAYNIMRQAVTQIENSIPIVLNLAIAAKRSGRTEEARSITRQLREANAGQNKDLNRLLDQIEEDMPNLV